MQMESNKEDGRAPFSALILSVNIGMDIIYCTFRVYPVYLSIPVGTVSQGLHTSTSGSTISAPITNPTLMSDGTERYPYAMQKSKSEHERVYGQTIGLSLRSSLPPPRAFTSSTNPKQVTNIDPYSRIPSFSTTTSSSKLLCKAGPSVLALTSSLHLSSYSPLLTLHL